MSKNSVLLLVVWNVLLSALLGWSLMRTHTASSASPVADASGVDTVIAPPITHTKDTAALKDAHIAFFFMDSIQSQYALVKDRASVVRNEGQRMEAELRKEMQKAEARYTELMGKDHAYSTQAELKADQDELEQLQGHIQELRSNSQDQLDQLQTHALQQITMEIQNYLTDYNKTAGFDYIFSIQDGGQIWVGNRGLDISEDVVNGLNAKYAAKKVVK